MRFSIGDFVAIRKFSDFLFMSNFCRQPIAELKQMCYNYDISQNGALFFMEFSEQIKYVRLKLHMSQTEFGQLLGVSFTTVNRWENGKTTPNYRALRTFEQLCKDKNIPLEIF